MFLKVTPLGGTVAGTLNGYTKFSSATILPSSSTTWLNATRASLEEPRLRFTSVIRGQELGELGPNANMCTTFSTTLQDAVIELPTSGYPAQFYPPQRPSEEHSSKHATMEMD